MWDITGRINMSSKCVCTARILYFFSRTRKACHTAAAAVASPTRRSAANRNERRASQLAVAGILLMLTVAVLIH